MVVGDQARLEEGLAVIAGGVLDAAIGMAEDFGGGLPMQGKR
jgi:hypothetical protein